MWGDEFVIWMRAILFLAAFVANTDDFGVEASHLKMQRAPEK